MLEYQYGRGRLTLTSADPRAQPRIENRFCEDERDLDRLVGCFEDTLAFADAEPLADMIESVAFPDLSRGIDKDTIRTLCRTRSASGYHPCGTAKMGPAEDHGAVVDEFGRVHVLDNVVVADASIMPGVPRANTNLTSIMIGEMVGEWIRKEPARYS